MVTGHSTSPARLASVSTAKGNACISPDFFILRPVATSLLMVAILLVGAVAYYQLPVSALPEVDYPTIQVLTFYPGASPDVMASTITAPLERQFGQVPGLQQMTSISSDGSSVITLQFVPRTQHRRGATGSAGSHQRVRERFCQRSAHPADLQQDQSGGYADPHARADVAELPLSKVEDLADTRLAQKISQLPGVGLVSISGGQKPAVRIQANPMSLASYGLTLEDLRTALSLPTSTRPKGSFDGSRRPQYRANDQLLSSSDYRALIVTYHNGAPVR